ncbi:hypothetical protein GGR57DRAFT_60589 [Xylariaceae sp. FL1272]|nr:hypothetical protein GGR57DRAFT_60589 [Xylariaceae sp. FL1272]
MAFTRRLTALSCCAVAGAVADARLFEARSGGAGDWAPATPTEAATPNPEGLRPPSTTSEPERPSEWELRRRRADTNSSTCGFVLNGVDNEAITCDADSRCNFNRREDVVGCCSMNAGSCEVHTSCIDSTRSLATVGPLTTSCGDSDRPYCVTYTYAVDFFHTLYGASFVGCAAKEATDGYEIGTSPGPLTTTATPTAATVTVTFTPSSDSTTTTATPTPGASSSDKPSRSNHVGAIVGGVIGGLAGLALIVAAILFFLYRRKRRLREEEANPPLGRKMPPSDIYPNEVIPGSQYPSTFYGDPPPGMVQTSHQPEVGYPPNAYATPNQIFTGYNYSSEAPSYFHPAAAPPPKPNDEAVSPIEPSPVSPVSPAEHYNTMVSALSNPSPPLQPLQPSHRQSEYLQPSQRQSGYLQPTHRQSEYSPHSPAPPEHFQSYRPYPGT